MKRFAALWVAVFAGCGVELNVGEHAAIKCAKDSECPTGYRCSSALGLCVSVESPDDVPPQLLATSVTPEVAAANTMLHAVLTVNEPLFEDPVVRLAGLSDATFLLVDKDSTGEPRYVLEYAVSGDEPEGSHQVAAVELVDRFGNENPSASLGIVTLDFSPPESPAIATLPAGKTASANIDVSLSAIGADEVLLGGDLIQAETWQIFATTRPVTLSSGDGTKTIFARFRDRAGNESLGVSTSVVLDTTAPAGSLVVTLTDGRGSVASGGELIVSGGASGDASASDMQVVVRDGSASELERIDVATVYLNDSVFSGSITLPALASGAASLTVQATLDDGANQTTIASDPVIVDDVAPTGLTFHFNPDAPTSLYTPRPSTPATLEIANPGQSDNSDLEMLFSGTGLAADDPIKDNWVPYKAAPTLKLDAANGTKTVTVTVRDSAHNTVGPEVATVTLDTEPPTSPSITIPEPTTILVPRLDTVLISANGADELRYYSDDIFPPNTIEPYEWIAVPGSGDLTNVVLTASPGQKTINAVFRDLAGNESDTVSASVTFSSEQPVSAPVLVAPAGQSRTKWNDTLSIGGSAWTGAVIESARLVFYDGTAIIVGDRPLASGSEVLLDTGTGNFSGSVSLLQAETPATAVSVGVEIVIRISGGTCPDDCSEATGSRSPKILIDNQPPENPTLAIDEGVVVNFRDLTALLGVDNTGEPGYTDIEVRVSGSGVHSSTPGYNTWIPWATAMPVEITTGDGPKTIDMSYRDGAHHTVSAPQVLVDYDTTPPNIASIQVVGNGGMAGFTNSRDVDVTVLATGAPTQVRISGSGVEPGSYSTWTDYDFASAIPVVLTPGDAVKPITVEIRDAALNESLDDTASIVLDTQGPSMMLGVDLYDAGSGKTHIHNNDPGLFSIWGSSNESNCTITSAEVLGNTGSGFVSLKTLAVPGEVAIATDGEIAGSFDLILADLSAYQGVVVQIIVADELGNDSLAALSRSNEIGVDLTGPQGTNVALASSQDDPTNNPLVQVTASSTDAIGVCFLGADTTAGAGGCTQADDFVPVVANPYTVEVIATEGQKTIFARFRDRSFLETDTSATVTFDSVAPDIANPVWAATATTGTMPDGSPIAWGATGTVTFEFEPDELPSSLVISGDLDPATVVGGCDSVVGTECTKRYASCAGGICSITFDLSANPIVGAQDCWLAAYAPGDGVKNMAFYARDDAGNSGKSDAIGIRLDRTCPDPLTLQSVTAPQYVTVDFTNYITLPSINLFVANPSVDEDFVGYETRLNGAGWSSVAPTNSFAFAPLSEGANTIEIRGEDLGHTAGAPVTTFNVTVDTQEPSVPEIAPADVTFNGREMTVLITQVSLDPGGDPNGADLRYEVLGGPFDTWQPVSLNSLPFSGAAGILYPFFELGDAVNPLPQQQPITVYLRASDDAGNTSPPGVLSVNEESTWVAATTSRDIRQQSIGLWGDHLAWLELDPSGYHLEYRDLGGTANEIWSSTGTLAVVEEVQAHGRYLVWTAPDAANAAHIYFHDLGADHSFNTGDEDAFPSATVAAIDLDNCPTAATFDFDVDASELAFTEGNGGACTTPDSLYVADTSSYPFTVATVCEDCVGLSGNGNKVAIDAGCVVWNNDAGEVVMRCRGPDGTWGTGDDVITQLTTASGDCSLPASVTLERKIDTAMLGTERIVVWVEHETGPLEYGLCVWRSSTGTAARVYEQATGGITAALIAGGRVVYSEVLSFDTAAFGAYDLATSLSEAVEGIEPGAILGARAWQDDIAFVRDLDGVFELTVFQDANERQITSGGADHLAPAIDGDQVVWVDLSSHECGEIVLYDASANAVLAVTSTTCPTSSAKPLKICPRISGTHIVWQEQLQSTRSDEIPCGGKLYGIDVSGGPPYGAPIEISSEISFGPPSKRVAISGDNVIFDAVDSTTFSYNLYRYQWSVGSKPTDGSPFISNAADPGLDENRLVFIGDWNALEPQAHWAVRTCDVGTGCGTPQTLVPTDNGGCAGYANLCHYKFSPRVNGTRVVWYDNRDATSVATVSYDIFTTNVSGPLGPGSRVTTTPVVGGSTGGDSPGYLIANGLVTPELGADFVVTTSLRKARQVGWGAYKREVMMIEFSGPRAFVEQTVTHAQGRQGFPDTDSSGRVVWEDRRSGVSAQVFLYERP